MPESKRYAADTEVSPEKSRAQLERLLKDHGAKEFHSGWDAERDIIEFGFQNLQIRFILKRPKRSDYYRSRSPQAAMEQADRQRWRALYLVVRAKLEAVESGLAIIENEFLANIVTPTNQTIGEILQPRLKAGEFDIQRALPPAPGVYTDADLGKG
jgi:hypothetical protein